MTLHLEEWGPTDGQRVVCLHGVTGHGRHFAKLAEALPEHHVLAPDLLGHGSSPYEPPWDLETHVNAVVETVGAAPAILIGHSFGGRLALELAARAPKLVPKLVLLDPAIYVLPHVALFAAENARKDRRYVSFEEGIERRYDESQLSRAPRELVEEELRGHLVWDDEGGYRYRYSHAAVVAAYGVMASQPAPFEQARVPTLARARRELVPVAGPLAGGVQGRARRSPRGRRRPRRAHRPVGCARRNHRGSQPLPRVTAHDLKATRRGARDDAMLGVTQTARRNDESIESCACGGRGRGCCNSRRR